MWLSLIQAALYAEVQRTGAAVRGSKLRTEVARLANAQGIEFPPQEFPKFSTLVEQFSDSLIIVRRKGMDFLVVPADQPELINSEAKSEGLENWLRIDVFDAFTKIPSQVSGNPFYIPAVDRFVWSGNVQELPDNVIEVPPSSIDSEVAIRAKFVESLEASQSERMAKSLTTSTPLKDFTQALHGEKLFSEWHNFRLTALIAQIKEWAAKKHIKWSSTWLDTPETKGGLHIQRDNVGAPIPRHAVFDFFGQLLPEDISRISIPLDIVLKLLEKR